MQGKDGDVFLLNGKTTAMKEKLITWSKNVKSGIFSNFSGLEIKKKNT